MPIQCCVKKEINGEINGERDRERWEFILFTCFRIWHNMECILFDICSVTNSTVPAIKIALEEGKKPVFSTLTVCYSCNGSLWPAGGTLNMGKAAGLYSKGLIRGPCRFCNPYLRFVEEVYTILTMLLNSSHWLSCTCV